MCNVQIMFELAIIDIFLQIRPRLRIINVEEIKESVTDMLK